MATRVFVGILAPELDILLTDIMRCVMAPSIEDIKCNIHLIPWMSIMLIKLCYANLNYLNNIMIIHSSKFHPIVMKFGKHYFLVLRQLP